MKDAVRSRFRLMRRRVRSRFQVGLGLAVVVGSALMLLNWAGYRGKAHGWGDPIKFSEAFPSLPIGAGVTFVFYVLWPWRHKDEDTSL